MSDECSCDWCQSLGSLILRAEEIPPLGGIDAEFMMNLYLPKGLTLTLVNPLPTNVGDITGRYTSDIEPYALPSVTGSFRSGKRK